MNVSLSTPKRRRIAAAATAAVGATVIPIALIAAGTGAGAAEPGPFGAGNLVVYRVGDGSSALTGAATAAFLDEYSTSGTKVQSVPLPVASDGAQHRVTASGTSASEGALSLSSDGKYLLATGYDAAPGTTGTNGASLTATAPSSVARVVARIDGNASIDATTALTDALAPKIIRTAAAASGATYVVAGSGGAITAVANGATTGTAVDSTGTGPFASEGPNVYDLGISGGQLYASGANGVLVSRIGSGVPSGAAAATTLAGLPSYALASSFALLDLSSSVAGPDTLYFVDQSDRQGAVEKYSYNGATWVAKGSAAIDRASGLAVSQSGGTAHLYISSPSKLYALDDASAATSTLTGAASQIATAAVNEAFRGIAFAPTAPAGPSAVLTSPASGSHVAGSTGTLAVSAEVAAPAGVSAVSFAIDGGGAVAGTDVGSGRWTASLPLAGLLAPHTHTVVVTVTDKANHVGTDARTFTLDSTAAIPAGVLRPGAVSLVSGVSIKRTGFAVVKYTGAPKSKGLRAKNGKGTETLKLFGSGFDLHLGVAPKSGKVQVFVDGKRIAVIDLNGPKAKDLVKKVRNLKRGVHTLKLVGAHQKAPKSKGYVVTLGWLKIIL